MCLILKKTKLKHRESNKLFLGKKVVFSDILIFGLFQMYLLQQQPIYYTFISFVTHII